MKTVRLLSHIKGNSVSRLEKGIGSFFCIFFEQKNDHEYSLWIYDTEWALTVNNVEMVSSDNVNDNSFDDVIDAVIGKRVLSIDLLDENEFHIEFGDGVFLELWSNDGGGNQLGAILLYRNGKFIEGISYPVEI